jgi:FKBP-type peptidyl-prolyl cis-trans isomerase FklB
MHLTTKTIITLAAAATLSTTGQVFAQKDSKTKKGTPATQVKGVTAAKPETKEEKISYAIGLNIANGLSSQGITLNADFFAQAIKDFNAKGAKQMSEEEVMQILQALDQELRDKAQANMQKNAAENAAAGQRFLEENKKRPGVKVTPSGLQYEVIREGTGPIPKETDKVKTHYHGTLIDGSVFDSSVERGQPAVFPVNGVIKGWVEALQMMKVGSKWKLYIPSDLAYGPNGSGPKIGPNTTLIFEVELLSIEN